MTKSQHSQLEGYITRPDKPINANEHIFYQMQVV